MTSPEDVEITLAYESQRAVVSPTGASLRRYYEEDEGVETDIVWGYSGGANKKGGQGDVLIPFPSRVKDGRYAFGGRTHQMAINDKEGPNAIHGFLRSVEWGSDQQTGSDVRFHTRIRESEYARKGYPFSLDVDLSYRLSDSGLTCAFEIRNTGATDAPVGVGFHPYFTVGTETVDETEALIPASQFLEFETTLVPTGSLLPAEGTPYDFRRLRRVGDTRFNHCYTDVIRDGRGIAEAKLRDPATGRTVTVWMDESFRYVVVYTGDAIPEPHARRALAIEPMTCATDAFNHPEWGLVTLAPGQILSGSWGVTIPSDK